MRDEPPIRRTFRVDAAAIIRAAGTRRLVVVAPHPDDETLGCGQLIAAAVRAGVRVAVIVLTGGEASHPGSRRWPSAALGRLRRAELRRALARLGAGGVAVRAMGWRDGHVAADGSALALRRVLTGLGAGAVVAASPRDHHPDHQAAWRLSTAATRGGVALFSYAVWSRVGAGGPRARARIRARTRDRARKNWAVRAHRSQASDYIADDPSGFRLSAGDLASLTGEAEVFTTAGRSAYRR
jgi:LmbE family N-acetylglucosaminyl deacetylase